MSPYFMTHDSYIMSHVSALQIQISEGVTPHIDWKMSVLKIIWQVLYERKNSVGETQFYNQSVMYQGNIIFPFHVTSDIKAVMARNSQSPTQTELRWVGRDQTMCMTTTAHTFC